MCFLVLTEGSLDSGQDSAQDGGSPSLHVDVNRAEGHSCRVLAAVAVWAQGRRGGWLGDLGLQLPSCPHFPVMRYTRMAEPSPSYALGNELCDYSSSDEINIDHR